MAVCISSISMWVLHLPTCSPACSHVFSRFEHVFLAPDFNQGLVCKFWEPLELEAVNSRQGAWDALGQDHTRAFVVPKQHRPKALSVVT